MYIYAKKAFEFKSGAKRFRTRPKEMIVMPEEFKADPLFAMALKDGSIVVTLDSKTAEKVETETPNPKPLNKFNFAELQAYAAEHNIALEPGDNSKAKILAKIEAFMSENDPDKEASE